MLPDTLKINEEDYIKIKKRLQDTEGFTLYGYSVEELHEIINFSKQHGFKEQPNG